MDHNRLNYSRHGSAQKSTHNYVQLWKLNEIFEQQLLTQLLSTTRTVCSLLLQLNSSADINHTWLSRVNSLNVQIGWIEVGQICLFLVGKNTLKISLKCLSQKSQFFFFFSFVERQLTCYSLFYSKYIRNLFFGLCWTRAAHRLFHVFCLESIAINWTIKEQMNFV